MVSEKNKVRFIYRIFLSPGGLGVGCRGVTPPPPPPFRGGGGGGRGGGGMGAQVWMPRSLWARPESSSCW